MKKLFAILCSMLFLFGAAACGTQTPPDVGGEQPGTEQPGGEKDPGKDPDGDKQPPEDPPAIAETPQLIRDNKMTQGFNLSKQHDGEPGYIGELVFDDSQKGKLHYWDLCQWNSGYYHKVDGKFPDDYNMLYAEKTVENGTYTWQDRAGSKTFSVNPESGVFYLGINGSKEYYERRPLNEGFMTYVINFTLDGEKELHVSKMKTLFCEFEYTLEKFERADYADDQAQFVIYFILRNRNKDSKDYMQYLWFGLYPYDNRFTFAPDHQAFDTNTTSGFIYGIGAEKYLLAKPEVGVQTYFMFDLAPYARDALAVAQSHGAFKNTSFEEIEIEGGNIGWEVGGAYDVGMTVSMFNLFAEYNDGTATA